MKAAVKRERPEDGGFEWHPHLNATHCLGCDEWETSGRVGAAMDLVKRCQGAEWELKRTAGRLERLQQERRLVLDMAGPPSLSPAEIERLAMLAEQSGQLVRAVGKVLRHGWESESPYTGRTNRVALEREIGSVRAVVGLLLDAEDVRLKELQSWQRSKRVAFGRWTHHQVDSPTDAEMQAMMREIAASQGMER